LENIDKTKEDSDLQARLTRLERENRKLNRENTHLKHAIAQEKIAYTAVVNLQQASTYIQRDRERYLALLLANSPSIIMFVGQTGRVEFCTEYFAAKAGFASSTDVMGRTVTEVFSPILDESTKENWTENIKNIFQTNVPIPFEVTFSFSKDGSAEDFAGLLVPMNEDHGNEDENQNGNGVMLLLQDVTALKQSREDALAASKAKSDFLSSMSHEIRTPMNAIIGMTSIGKHAKDLERKDHAFEKIESASTHLLGVINDILDISKIESGKMELSLIPFSFSKMLDRVMTVISQKIWEKRQHFSVEIDPKIPDALFGDDQRLAQVITNILSNATKFTPEEGDITLNAELLSLQEDECVIQMSVKDSGIGMSKQDQSKLFSAFQQAQAGTSRKFGGSGLGLAISKRILELMNGEIWVESEPGEGSCFIFTASLGIPESAADTEQAAGSESDEENVGSDFSGKVILLADDMDINLEIVIAILEPTNVTIDTATSGKEAVDAFVKNPDRYDLILMDMQMPEVDGLQATRMIRALDIPKAATIPIIAMTANVFKEDIEKCIDSGMNDHLGKPIDLDDVMKMLSHYLH